MANGPVVYFPSDVFESSRTGPYLTSSLPMAVDFQHETFSAFRKMIHLPFSMHRKVWEFAFIHEMLSREDMLRAGRRGVGFGVGTEQLPSLFASRGCDILATDAPLGIAHGDWSDDQYSQTASDLYKPDIIGPDDFRQRVKFAPCDMNRIPSDLVDYDFCWSSGSLEHLGSLDHGLRFIERSLETLKPGGIAVHTTELNLSSNVEKFETPEISFYRRQDLEAFEARINAAGHRVWPLRFELGQTPADHLVDVHPFSADRHLKILLGGIVSTSVGMVIQRRG